MRPTDMRNWLWNYQTAKKVAFSEGTIEMLQTAGESSSTGVDDHRGVTTASLIMAALDLGINRPNRDKFLEQFYRSVGEERFQQMKSRFGKGEMAGPEIDETINQEDSTLSPTVDRIISVSAERPSGHDNKILPIDLLVSLAEDIGAANQTTPSCQQLVGESETFLPLLCKWLSPLIKNDDIPVSLREAFHRAEFSASQGRKGPAVLQVSPQARDQLNKFWDRAAIRPGNALSEALDHLCARKQNLPPSTTPGQLFLGLLQRGEGLANQAPDTDRTLEVLLVRRLSRYECKLTELWDRDGVKYAEASVKPEPNPDLSKVLKLAAKLEGECSPGSVYVAPRHLIAALVHYWRKSEIADVKEIHPLTLDDLEESLREHLPVFDDQDRQGAWESFLKTGKLPPLPSANTTEQETVPTGGKHNASRRHHPDELCLDIDRYAEASAQLLNNASDESDFVFGLYGPWGRGKTTLAEEIQARVEKKGYVCVRFCAWKYPTRPEIWVHLYEEVLQRSQMHLDSNKQRADLKSPEEGSWLQRLRISFRVGILSQGWTPLVLGSLLLLVSRLHWLDFSLGVTKAIGWSGMLLLATFALRSTKWVKSLRFYYGVLPNHREKLGLQSVIGQDLANLLKVWIAPKDISEPKPLKSFCLLWISAGAVCFACILAAVGIIDHGLQASQVGKPPLGLDGAVTETVTKFGDLVADQLPKVLGWPFRSIESGNFESLSTALVIASILGLAGVGVFALSALIRSKPQTFERLLLVVDDLDRCEPDQMLAIVESLRVFLDKSEMSRRMQILMLIDDRKLDQAILKRAREQRWIPKTRQERDAYCREQREKYFVTSIRLGQLDEDDISDLTSKILDREANENQANRAKELKANEEANKRTLAKDENDVSTARVVKKARIVKGRAGSRLGDYDTEIEAEVRGPATEKEMEEERESNRVAKARAKAEEDERERIEDELRRRTTSRPSKAINEKTKFRPIERQLLHQWVREQSDEHTSPRTIRTLITRYLLARLMISTFGFDPDAKTLLAALSGKSIEADLEADERRAYLKVAATLEQSSK